MPLLGIPQIPFKNSYLIRLERVENLELMLKIVIINYLKYVGITIRAIIMGMGRRLVYTYATFGKDPEYGVKKCVL